MKSEKVLILGRDDLIDCAKDVHISHLSLTDFKWTLGDTMRIFLKQNMVIFIERNGETRILKNRWGDTGKVMRKRKKLLALGGGSIFMENSYIYHLQK